MRDYAQVKADGTITAEVADNALTLLEVDEMGFDEMDRNILNTLMEKFSGGPVGLSTVAAVVGEEPDTIEDIYEPYLIQIGFLDRTPQRPCCHRARVPPLRSHAGRPTKTSVLKLSQFDYELPEELIAQEPLSARDQSRLLHLRARTAPSTTDASTRSRSCSARATSS